VKKEGQHYFIDLFAGCGGLSLGLEQAGFTPALVNELNSDAMETYLMNRADKYPLLREKYNIDDVWKLVKNDALLSNLITDMKKDYEIDIQQGELDLLVGGPPCQGYSGIGHRRSYSVEKREIPSNHLYKAMAELIRKTNPKIFLFENVKGILSGRWTESGRKGEIWNDVLREYQSIPNYTVRWRLIQAKEYGVPQNRPRVLMVGIRNTLLPKSAIPKDAIEAGFLPQVTNGYPNLIDLLSDLDNDDFIYGGKDSLYCQSARTEIQKQLRTDCENNFSRKGTKLTEQEYSKHSKRVIDKFEYMHSHNGMILKEHATKKFAQKLLPEKWDEKGPTITATCLADDYVHYSKPRVLTVREWARLQTFPDWYQFTGKRTTGGLRRAGNPRKGIYSRELPKYTQIGNAVPVVLAKKVGQNFMRILENLPC
jgi:DNA (cytosine-5)-methyltransferase 1